MSLLIVASGVQPKPTRGSGRPRPGPAAPRRPRRDPFPELLRCVPRLPDDLVGPISQPIAPRAEGRHRAVVRARPASSRVHGPDGPPWPPWRPQPRPATAPAGPALVLGEIGLHLGGGRSRAPRRRTWVARQRCRSSAFVVLSVPEGWRRPRRILGSTMLRFTGDPTSTFPQSALGIPPIGAHCLLGPGASFLPSLLGGSRSGVD